MSNYEQEMAWQRANGTPVLAPEVTPNDECEPVTPDDDFVDKGKGKNKRATSKPNKMPGRDKSDKSDKNNDKGPDRGNGGSKKRKM